MSEIKRPTIPQMLVLRAMAKGTELRHQGDKVPAKIKTERVPVKTLHKLVEKGWVAFDRDEMEYRMLISVYKITPAGTAALKALDL